MKKLNLSFCENLIDSDFFLITKNIDKNFQNINKFVCLSNKNLVSLDILILCKELKQLIRFFYFIKLRNKKNKLTIAVEDIQDNFLLISYFKNYFINYNITVSELHKAGMITKKKNHIKGLVSFCSFSQKLEKHLNYHKFILLAMFELDNTINKESSVYKIYNKLDNFKKVIFFIALLENILKIKN